MMRAFLLTSLVAALSVAACSKNEAPEAGAPPAVDGAAAESGSGPATDEQKQAAAPPGPSSSQSPIDWEAARTARTTSSANGDATVRAMSVSGAQSSEPPPVPVLLPSGVVRAQGAAPPTLVTTKDGYFATYKTPKYDAIVNGTNRVYETGAPAGAPSDEMKFTLAEAGAQLSFSRFGADYLIEFECRQLDGGQSCISEEEAKTFADSLFVAQTR
jgi:hypothetical protein